MIEPRLNEIFIDGHFIIQCKDSSNIKIVCNKCVYSALNMHKEIKHEKYCFNFCAGSERKDNKDVYFAELFIL